MNVFFQDKDGIKDSLRILDLGGCFSHPFQAKNYGAWVLKEGKFGILGALNGIE